MRPDTLVYTTGPKNFVESVRVPSQFEKVPWRRKENTVTTSFWRFIRWHITPRGVAFSRLYGHPHERLCPLPVSVLFRVGSMERTTKSSKTGIEFEGLRYDYLIFIYRLSKHVEMFRLWSNVSFLWTKNHTKENTFTFFPVYFISWTWKRCIGTWIFQQFLRQCFAPALMGDFRVAKPRKTHNFWYRKQTIKLNFWLARSNDSRH